MGTIAPHAPLMSFAGIGLLVLSDRHGLSSERLSRVPGLTLLTRSLVPCLQLPRPIVGKPRTVLPSSHVET
jgi:hypothetical protein